MADLLFSIGADDRDFERSLSRIDKSSSRTARAVERHLSFAGLKQVFRVLGQIGAESMDAYARSSEAASQRVEDLKSNTEALTSAIGEMMTDTLSAVGSRIPQAFEAMETYARRAATQVRAALDWSDRDSAPVWGGLFGSGSGGSPGTGAGDMAQLTPAEIKRIAKAQDEELRRIRAFGPARRQAGIDIFQTLIPPNDEAIGGAKSQRLAQLMEEQKHQDSLARIGALKLDNGRTSELTDAENERHLLRMRQIERESSAKAAERDKQLREHAEDLSIRMQERELQDRLTVDNSVEAQIDQVRLDFQKQRLELMRDELIDTEQRASLLEQINDLEARGVRAVYLRKFRQDDTNRRFVSLSNDQVADRMTRRQILGPDDGSGGLTARPVVEATKAQHQTIKSLANTAAEQKKLLQSIDQGISRLGGAVFQ